MQSWFKIAWTPFVAIVFISLISGCSSKKSQSLNKPNLVLIVIDALRADHLGCYGYERRTSPTIDRMAKGGTLFTQVTSTSSRSRSSLASLMTSLHPAEHGVRQKIRKKDLKLLLPGMDQSLTTLAESFSRDGYSTMAIVTNPYLRKAHGFGQGFHDYEECETDAQGVVKSFLTWLDGEPNFPFFAYLHFMDVHWPYTPPQPYGSMYGKKNGNFDSFLKPGFRREIREGKIFLNENELEEIISSYDGEIRYVDDSIDRLLLEMEKRDLLDSTIWVLTSDHGDEFMEHGQLGHGKFLYDTLLQVPLILWFPSSIPSGIIIPDQVSTIDIMPTLLEISGLSMIPGMSGRSLMPLIGGENKDLNQIPSFSEIIKGDYQRKSVRTVRYKLIRTEFFSPKKIDGPESRNGAEVFLELFDLERDPLELKDISEIYPGIVKDLVAILDQHSLNIVGRFPNGPTLRQVDPETEKRLRALGYLE